jgi:CBS domain-containing protein
MLRNLVTVKPDTPILDAVRLPYEHHFNSLPVVDNAEQLIGILTEVDIYLLLLRMSSRDINQPAAREDTECRAVLQ